jgi:hypothetical protein
MSTARRSGATYMGTQPAGIYAGGDTSTANSVLTEEFTGAFLSTKKITTS